MEFADDTAIISSDVSGAQALIMSDRHQHSLVQIHWHATENRQMFNKQDGIKV